MEHRCYKRQPVQLEVQLKRQGRTVLRGQIRDIGLGGMYIQTASGALQEREVLEVELILNSTVCHMKAWVVHRDQAGAGMMLSAIDH
jgi:c-di-GMP-binding flagellar brake protein YcgR